MISDGCYVQQAVSCKVSCYGSGGTVKMIEPCLLVLEVSLIEKDIETVIWFANTGEVGIVPTDVEDIEFSIPGKICQLKMIGSIDRWKSQQVATAEVAVSIVFK